MTENEEKETVGNDFISSKFWRILLVILSVIMIFAGPTYVIYGLVILLGVNLAASFATGFILFAIGLVLMWYLLRKKVIS
jgi:hypothetical protein